MSRVVAHPILGEVTLSQSLRARRISLCVRPSGAVRLTFPRGVSERRALAFLETKTAWVEAARARMALRQTALPCGMSSDEEKARTEELRRAAAADLPARIERIARQTGLRYAKLTIRASRTKWGSCSAGNTISLSLFLMTLPEYLRDYVIIHELCHTVHHDHSPRFHLLVDSLTCGCEKALAKELRRYSIR